MVNFSTSIKVRKSNRQLMLKRFAQLTLSKRSSRTTKLEKLAASLKSSNMIAPPVTSMVKFSMPSQES